VIVAVYVDSCLIAGSKKGIDYMINYLKNDYDFGLQIEDYLTDYLCGKFQINQETKTKFTMQPHLINSLVEKSGEVPNNEDKKSSLCHAMKIQIRGQYSFALD
jgi:hypothetical protein